MTVYVDNVYIPATVGRLKAQWCHLMADNVDELNALAAEIGLKQSWLQHRGRLDREHYDVTKGKRTLAVQAGAVELDWRMVGDLLAQLRRVINDPNLSTKLDACFGCDDSKVLSGPWCDAGNEEMWLCDKCVAPI